jgi:hypothetical protein
MSRRFPPPWTVETIPGGFKVVDANQQSLAYVYARETKADADIQTNSQRAFSAGSARRGPPLRACASDYRTARPKNLTINLYTPV